MKAFPKESKIQREFYTDFRNRIFVFWGDRGCSFHLNSRTLGCAYAREGMNEVIYINGEPRGRLISEEQARQIAGERFDLLPLEYPY